VDEICGLSQSIYVTFLCAEQTKDKSEDYICKLHQLL
jgi:hypothetical protein